MCKDNALSQRFEWTLLMEVAKDPTIVPPRPGVYGLRVKRPGIKDGNVIIRQFLETRYLKALKQTDEAIVELYALMSLPRSNAGLMYNPDEYGKAERRLERLQELNLSSEGSCPILYLGCTNNLFRRLDELLWGGHTANHAVWPLLVAKWELDYGWRQSTSYREDEKRLKGLYKSQHGNSLPPLMKI